MKFFLFYSFLILTLSEYTLAYIRYDVSSLISKNVDVGEPLILTDYIEKGQITEAQEKARVHNEVLEGIESYSGYITVNKTYNSNTFFWFFPSQNDPKVDPLILWFIGGPGLSCMITIFYHNGPLIFTSRDIVESRNYTLISNHSVIYIDNPIGTGFSFTDNDLGYARNQSDVARDSVTFLVQFFKLFPEYAKRDFYIGGDSYGGKYVISAANGVNKYNYNSDSPINLQGIIMGNGLVDIKRQVFHADYLYNTGLIDKKGRGQIFGYEQKFGMSYGLLSGLTGFTYYANILTSQYTYNSFFNHWVVSPDFRKSLHVGNKPFNSSSDVVRRYFEQTFVNPMTSQFEDLLTLNYRVLVYNGQLDMLFPYVSSQNFYESLIWPERRMYIDAERKRWYVDKDIAGYIKVAGNFHEALVRNAGHVAFVEQPKWTNELITRFTNLKSISHEGAPFEFNPFIYESNLLFF